MIINSIIQVNIGYIPRAGCSKTERHTIPFVDGVSFCPGAYIIPTTSERE